MAMEIAPYLLAYTKALDCGRYGVIDFKKAIPEEKIGAFAYDIVLKNEKRILLVDCKYYKDLLAGTQSTLRRTLGNFLQTNSEYQNQEFMIVFMTDEIEKAQRKVFDDYCKNIMGSASLNAGYCLISLDNFETDMNVLMSEWR